MKNRILCSICFVLMSLTIFSQIDYVELVIPEELKDNPKAIEYLENDVKQLNRLFNSIGELGNEFEKLAEMISKIDTNDVSKKEEIRAEVELQLTRIATSYMKVNFQLMWYVGKDVLADKEVTDKIIKRLDTDEGIAFRKSLDHIKLKKELLEAHAKAFAERLDALKFQ